MLSAAIVLFLVMDPLGNILLFVTALRSVPAARRKRVVARELLIAYAVLVMFLFTGEHLLHVLNISGPALTIAGGIVLFLIALRMVFPSTDNTLAENIKGEPFLVPLAIPYVAGPSTLATLLLLMSREPALALAAASARLRPAACFVRALWSRNGVAGTVTEVSDPVWCLAGQRDYPGARSGSIILARSCGRRRVLAVGSRERPDGAAVGLGAAGRGRKCRSRACGWRCAVTRMRDRLTRLAQLQDPRAVEPGGPVAAQWGLRSMRLSL